MAWPKCMHGSRRVCFCAKIKSPFGNKGWCVHLQEWFILSASDEVISKMLHIEGGCFSLGRYAETREQWGRLSGPLLGDHNNAQEKVFSMHYHSITQYHDIYNNNTTINKRRYFFQTLVWVECLIFCCMIPKDIVLDVFFGTLQKSIICDISQLALGCIFRSRFLETLKSFSALFKEEQIICDIKSGSWNSIWAQLLSNLCAILSALSF